MLFVNQIKEVIYITDRRKTREKTQDFTKRQRGILSEIYVEAGVGKSFKMRIEYWQKVMDGMHTSGETLTKTLRQYEYYWLSEVMKFKV